MAEEQGSSSSGAVSTSQSDDLIAKYKNLLNMARKNLEANKETIGEKDKQITALRQQNDELKKNNFTAKGKNTQGVEDGTSVLRQILCMTEDSNGKLWVLLEYTNTVSGGNTDQWTQFESESELDEFIQRTATGPPILKPAKLLSVEESVRIEQEAKHKVDLITEEFRRFKVRVEIARKQKDAETAQQLSTFKTTNQLVPPPSMNQSTSHCSNCAGLQEEVKKLQQKISQMQHGQTSWKANSVDQSDSLSNMIIAGGGLSTSTPAAPHHGKSGSPCSASVSSPRLSRKHSGSSSHGRSEDDLSLLDTRLYQSHHGHQQKHSRKKKVSAYAPVDAMEMSKNQYARQMFLQYLTCKDIVVKGFIEDALCKLFRFNDTEMVSILERRSVDAPAGGVTPSKAATADSSMMSSFTNLLGLNSNS